MTTTMVKRVLPADVYDALAKNAELYGGIGYGVVSTHAAPDVPVCILGHCHALDYGSASASLLNIGPITHAVVAALAPSGEWFDAGEVNDDAIQAINRKKGTRKDARVSFAEWCAELGVERGS